MFNNFNDMKRNFEERKEAKELQTKRIIKIVAGVVVGATIVIILLGSIKNVPVNSVGVRYSNMKGTIDEDPLASGMKFKIPFIEKITTVSTELRSANIDDMQITTKDAQTITMDVELQYRVLPENAVETFKQFRSIKEEDWITTILHQRIQRGIQESASQYTVSELMGSSRGEFQVSVDGTISATLKDNHLTVQSTAIDDIQVSKGILKSIEENAKTKQTVETAKQHKVRQEVENETKIAKAEADSKVKEIKAKAEAGANKKLAEGITPELIQYLEAQARGKHGWYKYNNIDPVITEKAE